MSLTEVLESVRELSPAERAEVCKLLDELSAETRLERFQKFRGSAKDEDFPPITLEDFRRERREMWKSLISDESES